METMRKLVHHSIVLLLVGALFLQMGVITFANDFDTNREKYETMCFSTTAKENQTTCRAFQEHINNEASDARKNLNEIRNQMSDLRLNILEYSKQLGEYDAQIEELERQIEVLNRSIEGMEVEILILLDSIAVLEESIKERDATIQERMISMQGFLSINGFVEIIMGASSFTDLVRRVEGISDITYYDNEQIKLLQIEKDKVEEDKIELERQRNVLEDNRENLLLNQETVQGLKNQVDEIVDEYRRQESTLFKMEQEAVSDLSNVQSQLKKISGALNAIVASSGWIRPITTGFRVSAGVWSYPGGGVHLGTDFAANVGTPIVAPANGVVLYSTDGCPTYGYANRQCGYPGSSFGGNQVYLMVSVNSNTYALRMLHMQNGTTIARGTTVNAGEVIGKVGSSGNSTGPHLHVEVIYLGKNGINYYAQNWNGDLSFGTGWYSNGLSRRCSNNGFSAPCRLNPQEVFGVSIGSRY
jgi:murein DD-endopeptidase MepM/ murein hydrolase activator NlpD